MIVEELSERVSASHLPAHINVHQAMNSCLAVPGGSALQTVPVQ